MDEEPIATGQDSIGQNNETPRMRNRGIQAYEAFRRADEEAEAIALEQSAQLERAARTHPAQPHRAHSASTQGVASPASTPFTNQPPASSLTHPPSVSPPVSRTVAYPYPERRYPAVPGDVSDARSPQTQKEPSKKGLSRLRFWQKTKSPQVDSTVDSAAEPSSAPLDSRTTDAQGSAATPSGRYVINPTDGSLMFVPTAEPLPVWWRRQPYSAIAHILAVGGTITFAWFFGILIGQILPGSFTRPPLQESILRKSNRFITSLRHFPELWQGQTVETRIEAIPLPETGPVTKTISLSPIQRQPLIDELNAIETEILTLDRRIQILEKQLGRPPYEGADINLRVNSLRSAIDPPLREPTQSDYVPKQSDPRDHLLEVVERKIILPADALFTPGQSTLKDADILNPVLDQLVNYPGARVVIRSFSDNQTSRTESRKYTLAQANALSRQLQSSLPEKYHWVTVGGGETQAIESNQTAPGRQRNRRIEILIDSR